MATPRDQPEDHAAERSERVVLDSTFRENLTSRAEDISTVQRLIRTAEMASLQEVLQILERISRALASEHERSKIFWEALVKVLEMCKNLEKQYTSEHNQMRQLIHQSKQRISDQETATAWVDTELQVQKTNMACREINETQHEKRIARLEIGVEQLKKGSYDGILFVEIPNYSQKKAAAMTGTPSFYSDDFYADHNGYRMCARIYLNGDGVGKGSHLSIFLAIKKGRYDNYLSWPFQRQVTFTLLNQAGKDHLSDAFRPDPTSSSFQKPVKEMNIASGCPMFVAHKVIENKGEGFLRNNTICLRVKVDPPVSR